MSPEEFKELGEKQTKLVAEVREIAESSKATSAEAKLKMEKIDKALDLMETENQKHVLALEEAKKKNEEDTTRLDTLEKAAARVGRTEGAEITEEAKSFAKMINQAGTKSHTPEELKYLRTDKLEDGGGLVPDKMLPEIQKQIIEVSPIKRISRVLNLNSKTVTVPVRTTIPSTRRPGEGGTAATSQSKYVIHTLNAYRNDVIVPTTREMLKFSGFNMEAEIRADAILSLAQQENADFVNGNAIEKSEGFMVNSDISEINSEIADDIDADNLIDLTAEIKTGYDPVYLMNRRTIAAIRKLKGGVGQYLWVAGLSAGVPNQINGSPYIEVPDMPNIGAGLYPIIYGDFRRGYFILNENSMEVVIDIYTQKALGIIEYLWREFVGGKTVLPEAFVKLKCAVT